jgi:3-hydroxybutyryl-CoA dehydrogenase
MTVDKDSQHHVGIVGGGTMGVGIAYVFAVAGAAVTVVEPVIARHSTFLATIDEALKGAVERSKLSSVAASAARDRLRLVAAIDAIEAHSSLVIETVPEQLELKQQVLGQIEATSPALIATNTSAISIDVLAASLRDPSQFLGMHFFNPVWSLPLVELICGQATSEESLDAARAAVADIGKESIVVADIPGFATSRLDMGAALEAMRMLEDGVASAEDIDRAAVLAYRHPVGPLRLSDIVGLDVRLDIARTLERAHGPRFAPPKILIDLVAQGRLGVKTGRGFHDWNE